MHFSTFLKNVHALATQLHDSLPHAHAPNVQTATSLPKHLTILGLHPPRFDDLDEEFSEPGLERSLQESLLRLFEAKMVRLQSSYEDAFRDAVTELYQHGHHDDKFLAGFKRVLTCRFHKQAREAWQGMLDELKKYNYSTLRETNVHMIHDASTRMVQEISRSSRGHDSDAVRILEQAFNHSPNITQAEKFQLAEVTGLKPKQVTIWFQNRRNRKGKRMSQTDPTKLPPNQPSPPEHDFTPSSPPTRDFTLSEKKRKSYGALGRALPDYTESDTDSPLSFIKKPRLPRSSSGVSDVSISSVEYDAPFTIWSSPSSRSTSSSSASSNPSDCFDSPSKSANVFKYINPLKYEVRAKAEMPTVTIGTAPQASYQGMSQAEVSPFTRDQNTNTSDGRQSSQLNGGTGLTFSGLQLNMEALDRELRESIQKAFELSASGQPGGRNLSSSSGGSQQETTDDDGWVDEDDFGTASAGRQDTPATGAVVEQGAPMPPVSQHMSSGLPSQAVYQAPVQSTQYLNTQSTLRPQPSTGSDNSLDSAFSYTAVENESFDLNQFFESAALSATLPSSSPFVPHQHHSSPAPTATPGIDANTSCFDLEVDMTDIQDYLDSEILANSLPVPQPTDSTDGMLEGCVGTAGQFYLNFDLSSNMFSLV
uniref:B mating type protein n=1 Tax=Ustilago esculenta TaxID=185366 RepID=A0A160EB46_9BASI|nr:b mating type protein [Ustilago esculenta]QBH67515.1 B mating type protein [Ustilago esculenta]QBH70119.1 homeodomain transcription factor bW2 [Ustilago esculenta]